MFDWRLSPSRVRRWASFLGGARAGTLALALLTIGLGGCASKPLGPAPVAGVDYPADFALSVTVMTPGRDTDDDGRDLTVGRDLADRPARYIVEPDGLLRAAVGAGASATVFPRRTKYLTDRQMASLWGKLEWLRPELQIGDPGEDTPRRITSSTAIIHVTAEGRRTTRVVALDNDEWAKSLVRTLGEHAWLSTGWGW